MNFFQKISLLVIPLILLGCGRSNVNSTKTPIDIYEVAPEGTDKPTITLEHDGKKFLVFAKPVITRNDISHIEVFIHEKQTPGNLTLRIVPTDSSVITRLWTRNMNKPLPVMIDGKMFSAPTIVAPIRTNYIAASGPMTEEMANAIAKEK